MVTIERGDAPGSSLEGIFLRAGEPPSASGAVVAAPHPLYGGSMDSPVVNEVAYACCRAGIASLRFNWRGVGASSGAPSGEPDEADADYDASLAHMADTVEGPILACGYSFGAAAAVRAAQRSRRVDRLLLVAPPPALVAPDLLGASGRRTLVVVGAEDRLAPASDLSAALIEEPQVHFEAIPETDHFFMTGLAQLGRIVCDWLGVAREDA